MKKLILPLVIIVVISACSLSSKKEAPNTFKKSITEFITSYPNIKNSTTITYNEQNLITKATKTVNDSEEFQVICKYNNSNLLTKLEFYFDSNLSHYKTIKWFTDSLHISKFTISEKETTENYRETYVYNKNKEMTQIIRYKKDSIENWQKRGSKYEFTWENGNMVLIKCYVPLEYSTNDSLLSNNETDNGSLFELKELTSDLIKTDYTLFYESYYTYDDKKNPFNNTSFSQLILPNARNISTNNPIAIKKEYVEGDVINFELNYEYNDLGFPTMTDINVTSNIEDLEKAHFTREFKY